MKISDLVPNINLEDYKNEFKARLLTGLDKSKEDNELKWLKEIVAFSNTQGGDLYVGINDTTHELEPLSHKEVDEQVRLLYQKIEERIEPSVKVSINVIPVNETGRFIICINVPKSVIAPVYVHVNGVPACYIRQFGRAKIATPEQIAFLVIQSEQASFDKPFTKEKYNEKDFQMLTEAYNKANNGKELTIKALESIGFINGNLNLSRGALLFKDTCDDEITLAKCSLFPGFDKGGSIVNASESYKGCLLDVISNTLAFIMSHSTTGYKKIGNSRIDLSSYPERALFEGVINAFAHRNYFISGTEIQFDIFKDRLEITSPGCLLGGKIVEKDKEIGKIMPRRRNEVICKTLELIHYMEAKGTGFDKIEQEYQGAKESQKPFISCDDNSFTLVLPDLTFSEGVIGNDNPYPEIDLYQDIVSPYDSRILSCCYVKERTILEIASFLGISSSTHLRKDILEQLVEKGYLYQKRIGKAFFYLTNRSKLH